MVRNRALTFFEDGWLYRTRVMSSTVRIRQVVMPQRSSYHTENIVISWPRRLPCAKRRYKKSGSRVSEEQSMSSSMDRPLLVLGELFGRNNFWRAVLGRFGFARGCFLALLPRHGFGRSRYAGDRGDEVGEVDIGQKQSCEPENMFIGKKRQQAEHRDNIELNLLGLVRQSLRQRMDGEKNHAEKHDHGDHEYHRDIVEHVGLAGRGDEERQMVGRYRIGCCAQGLLPGVLFARRNWTFKNAPVLIAPFDSNQFGWGGMPPPRCSCF